MQQKATKNMTASNPRFFFPATNSVDRRLGDTFGFVWASYAGLRELWWQVRGFCSLFPHLHINEVNSKFLSGLALPGGIDLRRTCLETEWSKHEDEFAKWIIFESCTLYESWLEKVCGEIFSPPAAKTHASSLQFPTGKDKKGKRTGFHNAIDAANATTSPLMRAQFFPKLSVTKLNRWATIEDQLTAYRYFKECRNAIIHSDGIADQNLLDLHAKLSASQAKHPSPFRHPFSLPAPTLGTAIPLPVKDSVLFATVVRTLICTFDAALSIAAANERNLEVRLKAARARSPALLNLPIDPAKRTQRVKRLLVAAEVPEPVCIATIETWMVTKKII